MPLRIVTRPAPLIGAVAPLDLPYRGSDIHRCGLGLQRKLARYRNAWRVPSWITDMTRLDEIEMAVNALPEKEYGEFRQWFLERDWAKWDRQIEADSTSGKLDFLVREAQEAKAKGTLKEL